MGQQFVRTLSAAGCKVAFVDLNEEQCSLMTEQLQSEGCKDVLGVQADFSKENDVVDVFSEVRSKLGPVDIFIHNVMAKPENYYNSFDGYKVEAWNKVMESTLTGAFLGCREASRDMIKNRRGSIVLTASTYALTGPDQRIYKDCSAEENIYGNGDALNLPACYSAAKGGLISMSRHLAAQWGEYNIRVNCLTPGGVFDGQEEAFHEAYAQRTPLQRMATWTDYNGAILFLCSDASRYMTGSNLVVDGGWTSW